MNNEQEFMDQFERECATAMEKIDGPQWCAKVQSDDSQYFFYAARVAYAAWRIGRGGVGYMSSSPETNFHDLSNKFVQMQDERDDLKQKVAQLEAQCAVTRDLIPLAVSLGARADVYQADCQVISINELKAMLGSERLGHKGGER